MPNNSGRMKKRVRVTVKLVLTTYAGTPDSKIEDDIVKRFSRTSDVYARVIQTDPVSIAKEAKP